MELFCHNYDIITHSLENDEYNKLLLLFTTEFIYVIEGIRKKSSRRVSKSAIYQGVCALYKDELSRSFVVVDEDDNVAAFARRFVFFIHTFLVGELIRSRGREKQVEAERMHVSIAWTGWL